MEIKYDSNWRKASESRLDGKTIKCNSYLAIPKSYSYDDMKIKFEREEIEEKKLIEYLLKAARKNVSGLKDIDSMKPLDKLRNGVPIRLKTWLKDMYIIYQDDKLYTVLNNSIIESNNISMILSHSDNEWEEYDIPEDKCRVIKEEDYVYFVNNIYDKLKRVELKEHEQNVVFAMKLILEKLI